MSAASQDPAQAEARRTLYEAITKEVAHAISSDRLEVDGSGALLRLAEAYAHVAAPGEGS